MLTHDLGANVIQLSSSYSNPHCRAHGIEHAPHHCACSTQASQFLRICD
jgi:hypothetical protein